MDMEIKGRFTELWRRYFDNAELPITYYYSQREGSAEKVKPGSLARCLIAALGKVRNGRSLAFNAKAVGCAGGRKYLGFSKGIMRNFEYFLSCGIPGKMEGERYKQSPELVKEVTKKWPQFKAPAPLVIFKRWDNLEKEDNPEVVIFFAQPDVLSGLFTLANFDQAEPEGAFAPMGAGCSSIVSYPYLEKDSPNPRAVIGMFDISARPYVPKDRLSFAVPMKRFATMMDYMEESFLITDSWKKLRKRIA
jgi:uncharacterized protein (DUF169 family)